MTNHPRFDDLPRAGTTDMRCAWGVFGPDDQLGTLNHLSDERRLAAAALVTVGHSINLTLPLDQPDPPLFRRHGPRHEVYPMNGFSWDDRLTLDPQASSQWDGFLHVREPSVGFYGGMLDDPQPGGRLGIDQWVAHGLVGRGVLLDVEQHFRSTSRSYEALSTQRVSAEDLAAIAAAQGVAIRPGDVLCLRFGWLAAHARATAVVKAALAEKVSCAGLSAAENTARYLWDSAVAAVVTDNPSVEAMPGDRTLGFLHHRLLTMLGMPLGELFALDELARYCADRGRWDFLFVANPLNLTGAIGSPGNALALL